jgi:serine protease
MATPHVAGLAALLFAAGGKNPDQIEKAIMISAHPPQGSKGWTDQYGHGVIDAKAALDALKKIRAAEDVSELLPPEAQLARVDQPVTEASDVGVYSYQATNWKVFGWGAGLLAFVLLTLARKERPGYLNVFASPGFLVPMLLTTVGAFFVSMVLEPSATTTLITLPIPDWLNRIIFGRGSLANPIVYSAIIPVVASLFAIKLKGIRPAVGGLAIGFAGILGYSAWANAPALAWLPFTFLAIPWLAFNALVCLFVARAMLKKEA